MLLRNATIQERCCVLLLNQIKEVSKKKRFASRELLKIFSVTPLKFNMEPKKLVVCRCFSFSKGVSSGSMLVFGGVFFYVQYSETPGNELPKMFDSHFVVAKMTESVNPKADPPCNMEPNG